MVGRDRQDGRRRRRCCASRSAARTRSIAHTRRNAWFVFQEKNLGSLEPGKLADLLVLDRDYLTVPADEIKNVAPVLTMVGGRIAYEAR